MLCGVCECGCTLWACSLFTDPALLQINLVQSLQVNSDAALIMTASLWKHKFGLAQSQCTYSATSNKGPLE